MTALAKVESIKSVEVVQHLEKKEFFPSPIEVQQMTSLADVLAKSPFFQKIGAGGVLCILLTARELGLPPMACLNGGLYTFSGQVTMSSKLMNMMITRAGHRVDILELNITKCRLKFWRSDRPKGNDCFEWEYTMDMAKSAGLTGKTNWKTNPIDMLFNRCMSGGASKFMADVTMGAYLIGEMPGDGELIDTIPDEIKTVSDVKPLYMEEIPNITMEQAIELSKIKCECSKSAQENFMSYLLKRFKITIIDELPANEYESIKKRLIASRDDHLKAQAEMNTKAENVEAEVIE